MEDGKIRLKDIENIISKIKVLSCCKFGETLISNLKISETIKHPKPSTYKVEDPENSSLNIYKDLDFMILISDLNDEKCGEYLLKIISKIDNKPTKILLIKTTNNNLRKHEFQFKRLTDSVNILINLRDHFYNIQLSDYFSDGSARNFNDFSQIVLNDLLKFVSGEGISLIKDYQFLKTVLQDYCTSMVSVGEGCGENGHIKSVDKAIRFPFQRLDPEKTKIVVVLITAGEELSLVQAEEIITKILEPLKKETILLWEIFIEKTLNKIRTTLLTFE